MRVTSGFRLSPAVVGQVVRLGSPRDVLPRLFSEFSEDACPFTGALCHPMPHLRGGASRVTTWGRGSHMLSRPREGTGTYAPKAPSTIDAVVRT